jgi:hypothetical protein
MLAAVIACKFDLTSACHFHGLQHQDTLTIELLLVTFVAYKKLWRTTIDFQGDQSSRRIRDLLV